MEQKEREASLYRFSNGSANILVSTDLASRGLDIPDIDNIIHYHMPESEDGYIHRVGRTARWEAQGKAFFLLGPEEHIPEYVDVTADVTYFSLDFTATIISSGLLEDMDLKELDGVDEMSDNMKKLEEATDKLSAGAGALEEGMETYKTYLNQYLAGVAALDQGAGALESGLQVMNEKKGDLQAGATLRKESLTTLHNTLATVQLPQGSSLDLSGMESAEKQLEED